MTQQFDAFSDSVSSTIGNMDGFTACGDRVYQVVSVVQTSGPGTSTLDPSSFSVTPASGSLTAARTLSLTSNSLLDAGIYTVTVEVALLNSLVSNIKATQTFQLTLLDPACPGALTVDASFLDL